MLNFDSFMICLNNFYPSINYKCEKAKVKINKKGNSVQILILLDINVTLNSKNEISILQTCIIKIQTLMNISRMTVLIQSPERKAQLIA